MIAACFLLPFADDNVAQNCILLGQTGRFFRIYASQLGLFKLVIRLLQLRAQIGHSHLRFLILFLAGGELLLELLDLQPYFGQFLFFLRFVLAELTYALFGIS